MSERKFDVVVFGATGFLGALTADYPARNAPEEPSLAAANTSTKQHARNCRPAPRTDH